MYDSQLQNSMYASSGRAKIHKNRQTLKASYIEKPIRIDLVCITGANASVRITASYAA